MNEKKSRFPWLPMIAVSAAYGAIWNPMYINYILYDSLIETLGITNMQWSLIVSIRVVICAILMVPGGWIADKLSTKTILVGATALMLPCTILEVLTVNSYPMQMISFILMGVISTLGFWPATLKAIRIIGGKEHQATAYGFFEALQGFVASAGNAIAMAVFATIVNHNYGFKAAMVSMGAYCFVCALLVLVFYKENQNADNINEAEERKKFSIKETIQLLKMPEVWLVGILIFAVMGFYNNQTYTTPYFTGVLGIALTYSGFLAIFRDYGAKILGGPCGGWVAQRIGSPTLVNSICLIICAILFFTVPKISSGAGSMAIAIILIAALFGCVAKSTMWATVDEANIPLHLTGTAIGIISLLGNSLPNFLFPVINGYLLDTYADNLQKAYSYYFTIIVVVCLVGAAAGFILLAKKKKRGAQPETAAE